MTDNLTRHPLQIECHEGEEAAERFTDALWTVLSASPDRAVAVRAAVRPESHLAGESR